MGRRQVVVHSGVFFVSNAIIIYNQHALSSAKRLLAACSLLGIVQILPAIFAVVHQLGKHWRSNFACENGRTSKHRKTTFGAQGCNKLLKGGVAKIMHVSM